MCRIMQPTNTETRASPKPTTPHKILTDPNPPRNHNSSRDTPPTPPETPEPATQQRKTQTKNSVRKEHKATFKS